MLEPKHRGEGRRTPRVHAADVLGRHSANKTATKHRGHARAHADIDLATTSNATTSKHSGHRGQLLAACSSSLAPLHVRRLPVRYSFRCAPVQEARRWPVEGGRALSIVVAALTSPTMVLLAQNVFP